MRITVQHEAVCGQDYLFTLSDGIHTKQSVTLPNPLTYSVPGYDTRFLSEALTWYLEDFLKFPEGANIELANAVVESMKSWGKEVYNCLFNDTIGGISDSEHVEIVISSDSPSVLAWPWEVLYDETEGFIAQKCSVVRSPANLITTNSSASQNDDVLNILYIISRPMGEKDVNYHAFAREILTYIKQNQLAVKVDVLRPPTFSSLRQILKNRVGHYQVVHFDGHGTYGYAPDDTEFEHGPEGRLAFESEREDGVEYVSAEEFGHLLSESDIPLVVLSACRSAMIDGNAADIYASVAARLLKAGVKNIVAMGYSLYVSGGKLFIPAFYKELFHSGSPENAILAGRGAMLSAPKRLCALGKYPLHDWIIPQLYTQAVSVGHSSLTISEYRRNSPTGNADRYDGQPFVGRGKEIYKLDKMLRTNDRPCLLIHGLSGVGKTRFVDFLLNWLKQTNFSELKNNVFLQVWLNIDRIYNFNAFIDELVRLIAAEYGAATPRLNRVDFLIDFLKNQAVFIVCDCFESVFGYSELGKPSAFSKRDRDMLVEFLRKLQDGMSTAILISRDPEVWLDDSGPLCNRFRLDGLQGEDYYEYCNLFDPDNCLLHIEKNDDFPIYDGNPQMLNIAISHPDGKLDDILSLSFRSHESIDTDGVDAKTLQDSYTWFKSIVNHNNSPIFASLSLFQRYVEIDWLITILSETETDTSKIQLTDQVLFALSALERAGLSVRITTDYFQLHPALSTFLSRDYPPSEGQCLAYIRRLMLAVVCSAQNLYNRNQLYSIHWANFIHAKDMAANREMAFEDIQLTLGLASYANDQLSYKENDLLFDELDRKAKKYNAPYYITLAEETRVSNARKSGKTTQLPSPLRVFFSEFKRRRVSDSIPKTDFPFTKAYIHSSNRQTLLYSFGAFFEFVGVAFLKIHFPPFAFLFFTLGINTGAKSENAYLIANGYNSLGYLSKQSRWPVELTIRYHKIALFYYRIFGDRYYIADTLSDLGCAYKQAGKQCYSKAKECIHESLQIAHRESYVPVIAANYNTLGQIAAREGDNTTAKGWFEKAAALWDKLGYPSKAAVARRNIVWVDEGVFS